MSADSSTVTASPAAPETHKGNFTVSPLAAWVNVALAALLMVATTPGRTQGLGLITEPLLKDLKIDPVTYAGINLWATLLGAAFCLPAGWLIDRWGLRKTTVSILLLLAGVVWQMSNIAGGIALLFVLVLLTRALGQSALSVASITAVGKGSGLRTGWAMGVYSLLIYVLMAVVFVVVGNVISGDGWRVAWSYLSLGLVAVAVLVALTLREPLKFMETNNRSEAGMTLGEALRTPVFWVFGGATALFGLVASGLGLFNEAVLAERGFNQETYHTFMAVTTLFALVGQMLFGWLSQRHSMGRLMGMAMFLYAIGLGALPTLQGKTQLWIFAGLFGTAAGFIGVVFFAIWGQAFGRAHLGRIQGAAQMLTVFASALGPLVFAKTHAITGSYATLLYALAPLVLVVGFVAWWTKVKPLEPSTSLLS
ncbi:MAG: MFS transporter [Verrucomicrobium sp.]|nr:MFS transporter [Verrucomicrobium sp.]